MSLSDVFIYEDISGLRITIILKTVIDIARDFLASIAD